MSFALLGPSGAALEAQIQGKAAHDAAFREAFIQDPHGALKSAFGLDLSGLKIQVMESPADTVVVCLPPFRGAAADGELSDSALDEVAGGVIDYNDFEAKLRAALGITAPSSTGSADDQYGDFTPVAVHY